jgi:hypothetical protein
MFLLEEAGESPPEDYFSENFNDSSFLHRDIGQTVILASSFKIISMIYTYNWMKAQ